MKNFLTYKVLRLKQLWQRFRPWIIRPKHMIFLFGSPGHSNLGDQAQTFCIEKWLMNNYPGYTIRIFTLGTATKEVLNDLRKFIRKEDLLFCHSGYHMTDLYNERLPYMELARKFPDYRIVIFPQTIHFRDQERLKEAANVFNNHGNTILMCRDYVSYETAKAFFIQCHLLLIPDIVTTLIGTKSFNYSRNGVLFCIRNDVEAYYSKEEILTLREKFVGIKTTVTDTTLQIPWEIIANNRELVLNDIVDEYAHYQVVITDRYHGTILSLISGTPVVVIDSADHKLSSGVEWFPNEYSEYVCFASNLDDAYFKAMTMMQKVDYSYHLPPYFKTSFFDDLKKKLEHEHTL